MRTKEIILILLCSVLSAGPVILLKHYLDGGQTNQIYLFAAILANVLLIPFYIMLLKTTTMTIIQSTTKILSVIVVAFIGHIFMGEELTLKTIIEIIIGLIMVFMIDENIFKNVENSYEII